MVAQAAASGSKKKDKKKASAAKAEKEVFLAAALEKNSRRAGERLGAYLRDPGDDENVHDVRTSLRRLEAAFSLMPKKLRRNNRRQIDAYKEFFRANSRVRDCDIMLARIAASGGGSPALLAGIKRERKAQQKRALELGRALAGPSLAITGVSKIAGDKLEARTGKVMRRLITGAEQHREAALRDKKAERELHELRKDLKKLRYVLEIVPARLARPHRQRLARLVGASAGRGDRSSKSGKDSMMAARLKELQDLTGTIHDIDITVDYLRGFEKGGGAAARAAKQVMEKELAERDALYEKFSKMFRR